MRVLAIIDRPRSRALVRIRKYDPSRLKSLLTGLEAACLKLSPLQVSEYNARSQRLRHRGFPERMLYETLTCPEDLRVLGLFSSVVVSVLVTVLNLIVEDADKDMAYASLRSWERSLPNRQAQVVIQKNDEARTLLATLTLGHRPKAGNSLLS